MGRKPPEPQNVSNPLDDVVRELRRMVDALNANAEKTLETPVVNVDVASPIIQQKGSLDTVALIGEISRLKEAIISLAKMQQEPPVVNIENNPPAVNIPDIKMPSIHIPDTFVPEIKIPSIQMPQVVMPEIKIPAINLVQTPRRPWKFSHRYDIHNKIIETTVSPQ